MKVNYIIVDDEPIAHRIIQRFCDDVPGMNLQENCYGALEAMTALNRKSVDLMFLDINMPKIKGLDFLKTINNPPIVIITSAYQEYALDGYELNVCDYLLKPFSFDRFLKALNKALEHLNAPRIQPVSEAPGSAAIFIKGDKKHHQVQLNNITHLEGYGNYTKVHLDDKMILTHEKLSHFENTLPQGTFIRIHKSFIIAISKIKSVEGNKVFLEETELPIGQVYRNNFMKLVNHN